ncbi:MAG TPA: NYN domain-containing protein, partial [Streptosporangiaceae bacterium]|nr:NYN domain-containing protein [Streptosporangiaceae bacterium]
MDRCALFVDAGYALADGALAVHGTRHRDSVTWDYEGLLKLLAGLSRDRTGLPVLRCYWYEATVDSRRTAEHDTLADIPGLKLRLGRVRPGRREGVETEIRRDLTALARNKAVSDVVIVSAEEDLAQVISDVQDQGLRVALVHIAADGDWTVSRPLRQECDDIIEISAGHLRPYVDLIPGAEPAIRDEEPLNSGYRVRNGQAGNGASVPAAQPASSAQQPVSQQPVSQQSSAQQSVSQQPVPLQSVPLQSVPPQPVSPQPVSQPPTGPQPSVAQPSAAEPSSASRPPEPAPEMPAHPGSAQPLIAQPLSAQPLSAQSLSAQSLSAQSLSGPSMPGSSMPGLSQPREHLSAQSSPGQSSPGQSSPAASSPAAPQSPAPPPALYPAPVSGEYPQLHQPAGGSSGEYPQ